MRMLVATFTCLLLACATAPKEYPRPPLAESHLVPMLGHKGLVSNECKDVNGSRVCNQVEYDLEDSAVRRHLRELKFVCDVNGEIYRPALVKPGIIHEEYKQSCFLFICSDPELVVEKLIRFDETQRMLDAKTYCFSWAQYPLEEIFE